MGISSISFSYLDLEACCSRRKRPSFDHNQPQHSGNRLWIINLFKHYLPSWETWCWSELSLHGSSLNPNLVVLTTFVPLANKIILQGEKCTACLFGYAQIRNPTLWQIGSNVGSLLLWNTLRRTWIMLRFTCGTHPLPTRLSLPGINSTRVQLHWWGVSD